MSELKPCPFCGENVARLREGGVDGSLCRGFCPHCWAEGPRMERKAEALVAWNHRATCEKAEQKK